MTIDAGHVPFAHQVPSLVGTTFIAARVVGSVHSRLLAVVGDPVALWAELT